MLDVVARSTLRLSQLPRARLVAIHGDPATIALTVLLGLLEALVWACFITKDGQVVGRARQNRQMRRVNAMYRRRYAGRRLAWLRSEYRICVAGLVLTCRVFPRPIRWAVLGLLVVMAVPILLPVTGAFAVLAPVRGRGLKGDSAVGIAETLDAVDSEELLDQLEAYRWPGGPKGYSLRALWRAYLSSYILGMPSTNALIRRLQDDPEFRLLCGFGNTLPHRTTFNRFISRLDRHADLVVRCFASLTDHLAGLLPGLGEKVAVDSTTVRSHSNPNRKNKVTKQVSDLEASWTAKTATRGRKQKEWYWGYKFHLVADATYDIPLFGFTTTAKRNDSPELPPLLDGARQAHEWLQPRYVMADKGYDALSNYNGVRERGGRLIAPARRRRGETAEAVAAQREQEERDIMENPPTCIGFVDMEYVRTDPSRGMLFRCRQEGCKAKRDFPNSRFACRMEVWETPADRRLFGSMSEGSRRWKALYRRRQSVERVFKSLKESRRLERHFIRGLRRVALHVAMSVLSFAVTYLVNLLAGDIRPRWMVRKVA